MTPFIACNQERGTHVYWKVGQTCFKVYLDANSVVGNVVLVYDDRYIDYAYRILNSAERNY